MKKSAGDFRPARGGGPQGAAIVMAQMAMLE